MNEELKFEAWEYLSLEEIANYRRGSFPQPYGLEKWYDDENGHPFVQVYDVGDNMMLKNDTKRKISDLAAEKSVLAKTGTLLLTIQGSIGRIAIAHYDTYVDRTLLIFNSFKKPVSKHYFMFAVHRLFEIEKEKAHGSTIKTITKAQLSNFKIYLPPLPEQQKIADILRTVDDKLAVIDQQITATEELKRGLMQRLLTKGIGHTEFKDSPLGKIPKSWGIKQLSEIARCFVGIASSATHAYRNNGILLVRNQNIKEGYLELDDVLYIDEKFENIHKSKRLKSGDILTVRTGYPGISAVVPKELEDHQSFTTLITRLIAENINSHFLCYFINSEIGKRFFRNSKAGGGQKNVGSKTLEKLQVPIVTYSEQLKIVDILKNYDEKLQIQKSKKIEFQKLKNGLMQQLLTGKIRVNNLVEA